MRPRKSPYLCFIECGEALLKVRSQRFCAGLAEQGKHVLLVGFHARLIKRIDSKQQPAHRHRELEKVKKLAKVPGIAPSEMQGHAGRAAVVMRQGCAAPGLEVGTRHIHASQESQLIGISIKRGNGQGAAVPIDQHKGLEERAPPILDVLPERMKVRGQADGCRENTPAALALAFSVELLPPLCQAEQSGAPDSHNFDLFASLIKQMTRSGIPERIIGRHVRIIAAQLRHGAGAADHLVDVDAGCGDGEEADRRKYGKPAADIFRDDEPSISCAARHAQESAIRWIGGGDDPVTDLFG